ncbi:MAG: DUF4203 domain-containing protein [Candidatus Hydrogenedentota bacterium]
MYNWLQLQLADLDSAHTHYVLLALVGVGLLYTFFGYRLLHFILALTGFLLAALSAVVLVGWVSGGHMLAMGMAVLVGGICGALALGWLYRTGIFFLGGIGGWAIASMFLTGQGLSWAPWAMAGAAVAGALLALVLEKPVVVVATSALGALLAVYSVLYFVMSAEREAQLAEAGLLDSFPWIVAGVWGVLAVTGLFVQFARGHRRRKDKE